MRSAWPTPTRGRTGIPRRPPAGAGLVHQRTPGAAAAVDLAAAGFDAAGRSADPAKRARTHRNHRNLAHVYTRLGRYEQAHTELRLALDLCRQTQDQVEQAYTHQVLAFLLEQQGRLAEALDQAQQSLRLHQEAGHRHGQADLLNTVGWYHAHLGDHQQAVTYCEQALALLQELGGGTGLAGTWDSLDYAHRHLGHHSASEIRVRLHSLQPATPATRRRPSARPAPR